MRIFLAGQKSFGLAALRLIQKLNHEVSGVAAPRESSKGEPDKLFFYAEAWRIPVVESDNLTASQIPAGTDLIVAAHSHAFIGRKTRQTAKYGAIGYHPSLLPRHRGRDAVRWAIKMRDAITGGTVFWLNDSVDGGDIAAQEFCFIHPEDTASLLWSKKLFPMGIALLAKVLNDIEQGKFVKIPQDETLATWEPALNPPRLFRPELLQLSSGDSTVRHQVESDFTRAMRSCLTD